MTHRHTSYACTNLSTSYLPLDIRNADFLARFLIVVEPFALGKVNARKFGPRFSAVR